MKLIDELLHDGKVRRSEEKRRSDVIDAFRRNTERSPSAAFLLVVLAIPAGALATYDIMRTRSGFSVRDMLEILWLCGMCMYLLLLSLQRIWISPRDKVLLLLIDEAFMKSEPTPEDSVERSRNGTPLINKSVTSEFR